MRRAAAGQMVDQDAQQRAAQDGQLAVPVVLEPAAVAVDDLVHRVPGVNADGAVVRGVREQQRLIRFGVRHAGLVVAGDGNAVAAGPAAFAGPSDRVAVEHALGRQPDQQVNGLPGQRGGERGSAVPGVADDQRRPAPAGLPRYPQPAQQVPDLAGGLGGPGGISVAFDVDQRGR